MGTSKETVETVPLVEEHVVIDKRRVETGRVRVRVVSDEETINLSNTVTDQTVEVTRVPVGREVTEVPAIRQEGDITIMPVLEEILVVEKRLMLVEEVHIRRVVSQTEVSTPVTLRRQRADIERQDDTVDVNAKE
jgi:stress response protein YsnF